MNRRKENSFNPPRVTVGNNLQCQKYTQADSNLFLTLFSQVSLCPLCPLTVPTHSGTVFSLPGMLFPHFAFWYQASTWMTLFSICAAEASTNDSLQKSLPDTSSDQPPPKGSLPRGSCLPWGIQNSPRWMAPPSPSWEQEPLDTRTGWVWKWFMHSSAVLARGPAYSTHSRCAEWMKSGYHSIKSIQLVCAEYLLW